MPSSDIELGQSSISTEDVDALKTDSTSDAGSNSSVNKSSSSDKLSESSNEETSNKSSDSSSSANEKKEETTDKKEAKEYKTISKQLKKQQNKERKVHSKQRAKQYRKTRWHRKKEHVKDNAAICGMGCGLTLAVIGVFCLINLLNICAIGIGAASYREDVDICSNKRYDFPLSEWLVIVGCMGTFMVTMCAIVGGISKDPAIATIPQLVWFLPEFSLWICGIYILNNFEDNTCKEEFRDVWDMSVAWCVLRGFGFFSLCCLGAKK